MKCKTLLLSLCFLTAVGGLSAQMRLDELREQASGIASEKLSPEIISSVARLADSFDLSQANLGALAGDALEALREEKDLIALDNLEQIGEAASLSSGQRRLFEELKVLVDTVVLRRNLEDLPQTGGSLGSVIDSIRTGNYQEAAAALGEIREDAEPTEEQRAILDKLHGQYKEWSSQRSSD